MNSSFWGPSFWQTLHCVAATYPDIPNSIQKKQMLNYLNSIPYILPCDKCKKHFQKMVNSKPFKISYETCKDRKTLFRWTFNIHNEYNRLLKKKIYSEKMIFNMYNIF